MARWGAILWAAACVGCYHPASETACSISCDPTTPCPGDLRCVSGRCAGPTDTCTPPTVDASIDGPITPDDAACSTYGGTGLFSYQHCPADTSMLTILGAINTTTCNSPHYAIVPQGTDSVCVIYAHQLVVDPAGITATGTRPLVLAADELDVLGSVDVSSKLGVPGAGAGFQCSYAFSADTQGGGGPGGTGGAAGGNGGPGDGGAVAAAMPSNPIILQGGCPGGPGAAVEPFGMTGNGGPGGGVLYLIGNTKISMPNAITIYAGGSRGQGGTAVSGGGGGGGAGGMIVFDTPAIDVLPNPTTNLQICANGGGGGGGGSSATAGSTAAGSPGADGCTATGGGGAGQLGGGLGGTGSRGLNGSNGGAEMVAMSGGGGGGGGAGWVLMYGGLTAQTLGKATVSPAPK